MIGLPQKIIFGKRSRRHKASQAKRGSFAPRQALRVSAGYSADTTKRDECFPRYMVGSPKGFHTPDLKAAKALLDQPDT